MTPKMCLCPEPGVRLGTLENSLRCVCVLSQVSVVSFTGSSEVGRAISSLCAHSVTRVTLELGGNAPFIVFRCVARVLFRSRSPEYNHYKCNSFVILP
jgi:hypothetical protein